WPARVAPIAAIHRLARTGPLTLRLLSHSLTHGGAADVDSTTVTPPFPKSLQFSDRTEPAAESGVRRQEGGMTVREAAALAGACGWGPAALLALLPAWWWAALAGAGGTFEGLVAGRACGELLCRLRRASGCSPRPSPEASRPAPVGAFSFPPQ